MTYIIGFRDLPVYTENYDPICIGLVRDSYSNILTLVTLDFEPQTPNDGDLDTSSRFDSDDSIHEYRPNQIPMYPTLREENYIRRHPTVDFDPRVIEFESNTYKQLKKCRVDKWKGTYNWEITEAYIKKQNKKSGCGPKCVIF